MTTKRNFAELPSLISGEGGRPELVFPADTSTELGHRAERHSGRVLLLTDESLAWNTEHVAMVAGALESAGRVYETHVLPTEQLGLLDSALTTYDSMRACEASVCVALGGGSVLDAGKLARAAHQEPWLVDRVIWTGAHGQLTPLTRQPHDDLPALIAIPTRPNTAAQVSPRISMAPHANEPRRLVEGPSLLPTTAIVDPALARTLDHHLMLESVCEIMLRALGPYLAGASGSVGHDRAEATVTEGLLELGEALTGHGTPSDGQRSRLDHLSMATVCGWHRGDLLPGMHPWWCIQNTVATHTGRSKGSLTAQALPGVLDRVLAGDEKFGSRERWQVMEDNVGGGRELRQRLVSYLEATAQPSERGATRQPTTELRSWSKETVSHWERLPSIRHLGVDGVHHFLQETGF